jgi:hypothetical protein
MITLFRFTNLGPIPDGSDVMALMLFLVTWALLLFIPSRVLSFPTLTTHVIETVQTIILLVTLGFLLYKAWKEKILLQANQMSSFQHAKL